MEFRVLFLLILCLLQQLKERKKKENTAEFINYQIFLLVRDWPKRFKGLNIPQLKLWNIRD